MENFIDKKKVFFASILIIALKSIFFFTRHIQEDALISWRVARNIIEYGVYGYNGVEKISASTTHLYVFIGVIFQSVFGEENFIYPLLIFNTILFTIGIYWLGKLLFSTTTKLILLYVTRYNYSEKNFITAISNKYDEGEVSNVGIIFNDFQIKTGYSYGYGYGYGYGYDYGYGYFAGDEDFDNSFFGKLKRLATRIKSKFF